MPIITPLDFEEEIRKIRDQALKLPPIHKDNGYENFHRIEDHFRESLTLHDISTAEKRVRGIRSRRKIKKKVNKESSTDVKQVKKRKPPPIRKIPGEVTKSFSIVCSAGGSKYSLIQRQSSPGSMENCDQQEHDL